MLSILTLQFVQQHAQEIPESSALENQDQGLEK